MEGATTMNTRLLKRLAVVGALLFLVGLVLYALLQNSYIQVSVTGGGSRELTYYFTDQASNKVTTVITTEKNVKRRLPRGNYQIEVVQGDTSFFAVTNSPGLLRTQSVEGALRGEKARMFIGNNPGPCMYYDEVLLSGACNGATLANAVVHIPANDTTPTYTSKIKFRDGEGGTVEGEIILGDTSYILVRGGQEGEDITSHLLYTIDAGGNASLAATLSNLSGNKTYGLEPYQDGFVAYSTDLSEVYYFSDINGQPTRLAIEGPKDQELLGFSIKSQGDTLALVYSSVNPDDITDEGDFHEATHDITNELVVYNNGVTKHTTLKTHGTIIDFCGTDKVCVVSLGKMSVYDINDDKAKHLYDVAGVNDIQPINGGILLTTNNQILSFNADDRLGYTAYDFGGYGFCGQSPSGENLLLCMTNNKSRKVALLLDMGAPLTTPIDKQVFDLQKQAEVNDVSAYKNLITVVANYGRIVYDPVSETNGYDPAVQRVVNDKIRKKIQELGIPSFYTVNGLLTD